MTVAIAFGLVSGCGSPSNESGSLEPTVTADVHHDTSLPLRDMQPAPRGPRIEHEVKRLPRPGQPTPGREAERSTMFIDDELAPTAEANFDGIGNGVAGFTVNSAPPDTVGDVGPNHYVQLVNSDLAVFDKLTGAIIHGPVPTNTLWSGFGGLCQTDNDGDGVVLYDPIADRWVVSQFAVSGTTTAYLQCIAVSTTPDPTGSWNRYAFSYGNEFPDYPKMGVWPDAYYQTFNMFNSSGTAFLGGKVCAYDRVKMIAAQTATQVCFNPMDAGSAAGGLLPADVDGARQPPAGSPNYVVGLGNNPNQLAIYKFHVDFATPGSSTLTGPTDLNVPTFSEACGGGTCIPQSGGGSLDSLADRLMFRLAYRNFGDHEAMVVSHAVTSGSTTGVRWYELRVAGTSPSLFQEGTFVPTNAFGWMSSAAMDQAGNIALGYSVSSATLHPEIHYTGRLAGDVAGVMSQGDNTIINGAGSQGSSLSRWGDYSMMSVDPTDDCTFFFTSEYIPSNGTFNWKTRIGSFTLPGCGVTTDDFSISASPQSVTVQTGSSGSTTIATAVISGAAQAIALSASGLPAGASAAFSPASVTAGSSSTLTLAADAATPPGSYNIIVTGTGTSATHTTTVAFNVQAPSDFALSVTPSSLGVSAGGTGAATASTTVISGGAETVSLSASGLPAGVSASLSPASVTAGGSSTLTVSANASALPGTYTVTITGSAASATHAVALDLTITAAALDDFSISASPSTVSVAQGAAGISTISTAVTSGNAQSVSLSASGLPAGASASFSPTTVTAGGSSTLTISVGAATPAGSYAVTITGTGTSATHTTIVTLTVTAANGIVNGGFETGTLAGWTATGTAAVTTESHSGSYAAALGLLTTPTSDSSLVQTFTVPSTGGVLSFWYKVKCPDTITYDWATATLRDNTSGTTITMLAKTCTNNNTWARALATVVAGHSVTLTLVSHDDNYPGDGTVTYFDDVTLSDQVVNTLVNPSFESGLTGWTSTGATATSGVAHAGVASARVGSTAPFSGDSTLSQTFAVPAGATQLRFWYQVHCSDTVTYDWATVTLRDNTTGFTTTALSKTCRQDTTWHQVNVAVTAGHTVTITLLDHDDAYPGDPTYTYFDDFSFQ